jgi:hypothetical protein
MDSLQDFLHGNGSVIIKDEVNKFRDLILGRVRNFADQAINWIKEDIGHCQNIHIVYDSATTFICRNALDGLVRSAHCGRSLLLPLVIGLLCV